MSLCLVFLLVKVEGTKTSFLPPCGYAACSDDNFQERTMQSKTQPMKNTQAIINVMHFWTSVCKSDLVIINCCGPMAKIAENSGFQK